MYPCAYPPPTDAELWLRDIKSAWLRAPWVLDTVTDAAFREKYWLAAHDDSNPDRHLLPIPVQRAHQLPPNVPLGALSFADLISSLYNTPRRAAVRGGIPIALSEILRRKFGHSTIVDDALVQFVRQIWSAIADLWSESTDAIVALEKLSSTRSDLDRAIADKKPAYVPKVQRHVGTVGRPMKRPAPR